MWGATSVTEWKQRSLVEHVACGVSINLKREKTTQSPLNCIPLRQQLLDFLVKHTISRNKLLSAIMNANFMQMLQNMQGRSSRYALFMFIDWTCIANI
jgi:hypothetical protein